MAMGTGPGGLRLRPMSIGDILDATFQVYKRQFVAFIAAMAIVVVPASVLSLAVGLVTGISNDNFARNISSGAAVAAIVVLVVLSIVVSLGHLVAGGAVTLIASGAILGQPVSLADAYREALRRIGTLLLGSLVVGVALMLLVITCIGIPVAVYVGIGWSLLFPVVLLEGAGTFDALRRSWQLVAGHRWRLLISSLLIGLLVGILVSIPSGIFAFFAAFFVAFSSGSGSGGTALLLMQIGNTFFQAVGQTLFGAVTYVLLAIFYYELRVRKEAFDLAQRVPTADPAPPGWGAQPPAWGAQPPAPPTWPSPPPPGLPWDTNPPPTTPGEPPTSPPPPTIPPPPRPPGGPA